MKEPRKAKLESAEESEADIQQAGTKSRPQEGAAEEKVGSRPRGAPDPAEPAEDPAGTDSTKGSTWRAPRLLSDPENVGNAKIIPEKDPTPRKSTERTSERVCTSSTPTWPYLTLRYRNGNSPRRPDRSQKNRFMYGEIRPRPPAFTTEPKRSLMGKTGEPSTHSAMMDMRPA